MLCLDSVILGFWESCLLDCFVRASFSIALMNLRKYLMYSGNVSRLQWPPPFTHKGSYFSFESSHNRFPWDQSTISSFVPCTKSHYQTHKIINYTNSSKRRHYKNTICPCQLSCFVWIMDFWRTEFMNIAENHHKVDPSLVLQKKHPLLNIRIPTRFANRENTHN